MSRSRQDRSHDLDLRRGALVQVRTADEIMRTLDEHGTLDRLPFMPEMLTYCGRTLRVSRRADKTCDGTGTVRWMDDVVHLDDVRCDGGAHDGCQASCRIYWKAAWLTRPPEHAGGTVPADTAARREGQQRAERTLLPLTRSAREGEVVYRCQATHVLPATRPLPPWYLRQYRVDRANWGVAKLAKNLAITAFNKYQDLSRARLPTRLQIRGGRRHPYVAGRLATTPRRTLDLQPGEMVRVKTRDEILSTLDVNNKNRGLQFDAEMLRYCGQVGRVRDRIDRIIDEHTGRMIDIASDCVTLEGMVCAADYHRLCTRGIYHYWREIWLERVDADL